jgi:hypothetical protein
VTSLDKRIVKLCANLPCFGLETSFNEGKLGFLNHVIDNETISLH